MHPMLPRRNAVRLVALAALALSAGLPALAASCSPRIRP